MLNTKETRAGAMAAMGALRRLKENESNGQSGWEWWWKNEDEAMSSMLHAAGNPNDFVAGFIAAMAEYIRADLIGLGINFDAWEKPTAAMTEEEKALYRASLEKEGAEV
jgi:hypothetical protein